MELKSLIRDIPDFPKPGILFRDISPLLNNPEALQNVAEKLVESVDLKNIDSFVGIESRGFILASLLAAKHNKGFIPMRKAGKLPPPTVKESYKLEYGEATLEMTPGKGRVMILDDVLATGGTLQAGISICEKAGFHVEQVAVLINLTFLNTMKFRGKDIFSLVQY